MLKGTVQNKNGMFYTVISYEDENGKRKQKREKTGLAIRGNKRRAEELLRQRLEEFELLQKQPPDEETKKEIAFSKFMSNWLTMVKCSIEITTFGSYQYFIEKRINPYFDKLGMTLQKIKTSDIQEYYNTTLGKGTKWNSVVKHHAVILLAEIIALTYSSLIVLLNLHPIIETPG